MTRPSPDAVEAALARVHGKETRKQMELLLDLCRENQAFYDILAAEVVALRHDYEQQRDTIQRQGVDLILFTGEIQNLRAQLQAVCGECGAKLQ